MSVRLVQAAPFAIVAMILATDAHAQGNPVDAAVSHVGIGAGITFVNPSSGDANRSQGAVFVYHWHSVHSGWGPTFSLDWHTTDFNYSSGDLSTPLGSVRMRALLAGFGRRQRVGKLSTGVNVMAGYSFNDLSVAGGAGPAFANAGTPLLGASVDNSFVIKPDVSAWYDVMKHVGVGVTVAYYISRPGRTITTVTGAQTQDLRADALEVTTGLTFGLWKKR